jgi:nucleoside-diphosphate-sugar epimerase
MTTPEGTIAITGATGYVGRATVKQALAQGFRIRTFGRRPLGHTDSEFVPYDLVDIGALDALAGCTALIHLAAHTSARSHADPQFELRAARRIIDAAAKHRVQLIYVSSQTASPDAESAYARSKWLIEQSVREAAGCIIRPGLVYGGEESGLFGELCELVRRMPVLPAFLPAANVQPIHVDELATALVKAVKEAWTGTRSFARKDPLSFTAFLRILARERLRKPRIFIPFPFWLLMALEPVMASLMPRGPDLGQLRSLYATAPMQTAQDLKAAAISLRPVTYGMHRSGDGRRRALLIEGDILLAYILRRRPPPSLLGRYVRAIESLDEGNALALPRALRTFPFVLALFDCAGLNGSTSKVSARTAWASRIAEASVPGARRFLPADRSNQPVLAVVTIGWAVFCEALFGLARVAFSRPVGNFVRSAEEGPL